MIQVMSCEQALIKTDKEPIQEFQLDRHLEHLVSYQGMQCELLVFLVSEFGTFEIFMKNDCLEIYIYLDRI